MTTKTHGFQQGRKVKILKGMREAWDRNGRTRFDIKLREVWTIQSVRDAGSGEGVKVHFTRGERSIDFFVSAEGKLARDGVTLNTGDPLKTIKVALVPLPIAPHASKDT